MAAKSINRSLVIPQTRMSDIQVGASWSGSCRRWSMYNLSRPIIHRSDAETPDTEKDMIAGLNFATKKVTANLHIMEDLEILDHSGTIFGHELGHKLCPGDLKTMLLIDHSVGKVVKDEKAAHLVGNLFNDLIVNTTLFMRGDKGTVDIYAAVWKDDPDAVQQIIGRAYEKVFQRRDLSRTYMGAIIQAAMSRDLESKAQEVCDLILSTQRSNWMKNARRFAEIINSSIPEGAGDNAKSYIIDDTKPSDFFKPGECPIPPAGDGDVKKLQGKLKGVVFDLSEKTDGTPCSPEDFKKFLEESHIDIEPKKADVWFYRDLVSGRTVKVPEVAVSSGTLYPFHPKTWGIGDPITDLDINLTKSLSGVVIPGTNTKKWERKRGHHITVGKDYPDLDLWLDSSGSMQDPKTAISHAVASAMIIAKSFVNTKKDVRVVNFDSHRCFWPTNGFTSNEDEIDDTIVIYSPSEAYTTLPIDEFEKPYLTEGKQKYIVLITDLQLSDITDDKIERLRNIFNRSVGGSVFLIGPTIEIQQIFENIGFDVIPVKNIVDLDRHALKLTKKLFEQRIQL